MPGGLCLGMVAGVTLQSLLAIVGVLILVAVLTVAMRVRKRRRDERAIAGRPPFTSS